MKDLLKTVAKELGSRGGKKTAKRFGIEHYRKIQLLAAKKRKENRKALVDKQPLTV